MNDTNVLKMTQNDEAVIAEMPAHWSKGHGRVAVEKLEYPVLEGGRHHTWKSRLSFILQKHGNSKVRGNAVASNRTYAMRRQCIFQIFQALRDAGFKLEDPANIDARHVAYIHREWERRRKLHDAGERDGLAASSVANLASVLRTFCGWISQPQLIDYAGFSDPELISRERAATKDLSWEGVGIDTLEVIKQAWAEEPWVAVALLVQFTFGLREKEAVMFRPDVASYPGEAGVRINMGRPGARGKSHKVSGGSKGGRPRLVMIHAQWEREVLEFVRKFVRQESGLDGHVGCSRRSLVQNMGTYQRVLQRLGITKANAGVTGHGLRAAFAIRALHRHGLEAPVRGGDLTHLDPSKRELILRAVAEDLGHSRAMISTAYYGSVKQSGGTKQLDVDPDAITAPCIASLLTDLEMALARLAEGTRVLRAYKKQISEE